MSRVEEAIRRAHDAGRGAFIGYLPVGYPDLQTSIDAAIALARNGVDIIELGPPYSDPVMDGAIIQEATQAALANGFRMRDLFTAVKAITDAVEAPGTPALIPFTGSTGRLSGSRWRLAALFVHPGFNLNGASGASPLRVFRRLCRAVTGCGPLCDSVRHLCGGGARGRGVSRWPSGTWWWSRRTGTGTRTGGSSWSRR